MHYEPRLHVVLYQPEIPHNTGSVGRTCVAVGAKLWLVRPLGFRVDDHHLRRAGLDYWQFLEWEVVDNWDALCKVLPMPRQWLFSKHGRRSFAEVIYPREAVLVFGSESQGLPRSILERHSDRVVRIPTRPQVRSLNLSNAVAVACYQARMGTGGDDGGPASLHIDL